MASSTQDQIDNAQDQLTNEEIQIRAPKKPGSPTFKLKPHVRDKDTNTVSASKIRAACGLEGDSKKFGRLCEKFGLYPDPAAMKGCTKNNEKLFRRDDAEKFLRDYKDYLEGNYDKQTTLNEFTERVNNLKTKMDEDRVLLRTLERDMQHVTSLLQRVAILESKIKTLTRAP